ncbi:hypothetical protein J2T20_002650 [Paenibacillus wynnii]|nr:hypothetical protein [Paenibacillus wynnii]
MRLAEAVHTPFIIHEPIPVTINRLASILCYMPRNVKFNLEKLIHTTIDLVCRGS